jgi:hypothetical protein
LALVNKLRPDAQVYEMLGSARDSYLLPSVQNCIG